MPPQSKNNGFVSADDDQVVVVVGEQAPQVLASQNLPTHVVLSLQNGGDREAEVHRFGWNLISEKGLPSHQKLVDLVAGVHDVHPNRVQLFGAGAIACSRLGAGAIIGGDADLMAAASSDHGGTLRVEIAVTLPSFLQISLGKDTNTTLGIGGIQTENGGISVECLKRQLNKVAPSQVGQHPAGGLGAVLVEGEIAADDEMLRKLLRKVPSGVAKVSFIPGRVTLLAESAVAGRLVTVTEPDPCIEIDSTTHGAVALWNLDGVVAGRYRVKLSYANGWTNAAPLRIGFVVGRKENLCAKGGELGMNLSKAELPATGGGHFGVAAGGAPLDYSGKGKLAVVHSGVRIHIRSIALHYVGPTEGS